MGRWPSTTFVLSCKLALNIMAKFEAREICVLGSAVLASVRHITGEETYLQEVLTVLFVPSFPA